MVLERGERLFRSAKHRARYVSVAVPPIPISSFTFTLPTDGVVLRFQVPRDGSIGPLLIHAEVAPSGANRAKMRVDIVNGARSMTKDFIFDQGDNEMLGPINIRGSDRVSVSIIKVDPTDVVTGIWVTLTVYPTLTHADVKKFGEG